jgi:lantibiotic biosynthesis protein
MAGWDTAHAWLTAATSGGVGTGQDTTPYLGAPAVAFALHGAARNGSYAHAEAALDRAVATIIQRRLDQAHARIDRRQRPRLREFDSINGLAGFGAHLLRHNPHGTMLPRVLTYLARLTEPVKDSDDLPGWWTGQPPAGPRAINDPRHRGHSNHGMSHGIAGCLALLALAQRRGISVPGQTEAIERICDWFDTWQQPGPHGPWWPETLTLDDLRTGVPGQARPARPSWCYGTPGVAGDPGRQQLAEHAMLGCLADPRQRALITGPGLCHGIAGLFQTTWRMATDSPHTHLTSQLPQLAGCLRATVPGKDTGALDGTTGLALAQTTAATGRVATGWDTFLLLS